MAGPWGGCVSGAPDRLLAAEFHKVRTGLVRPAQLIADLLLEQAVIHLDGRAGFPLRLEKRHGDQLISRGLDVDAGGMIPEKFKQ